MLLPFFLPPFSNFHFPFFAVFTCAVSTTDVKSQMWGIPVKIVQNQEISFVITSAGLVIGRVQLHWYYISIHWSRVGVFIFTSFIFKKNKYLSFMGNTYHNISGYFFIFFLRRQTVLDLVIWKFRARHQRAGASPGKGSKVVAGSRKQVLWGAAEEL